MTVEEGKGSVIGSIGAVARMWRCQGDRRASRNQKHVYNLDIGRVIIIIFLLNNTRVFCIYVYYHYF